MSDQHSKARQHSPKDGTPRHVAIIMDGNGRWAERRGLPRAEGHRQGVEALRRTVKAAIEIGIPYLTVYSFSSENWSRPRSEIADLMGLFKRYIRRDLAELHRGGVKLRMIGERAGVDADVVALIDEAEQVTRANETLTLVIAFNYGGRAEIARAARRLAEKVAAGALSPGEVTEEQLAAHLDASEVPDPDLLIRTGGEERISNFLLWQVAYAELVFVDAFWPEFGKEQLDAALAIYSGRDRRYGGLTQRSSR